MKTFQFIYETEFNGEFDLKEVIFSAPSIDFARKVYSAFATTLKGDTPGLKIRVERIYQKKA